MSALDERLAALAGCPRLLVAVDFDGTISPIVPHPPDARPDPHAAAALIELAALADTEVSVVSGRSLTVLAELTGELGRHVRLIGGHGLERPDAPPLTEVEAERLHTAEATLDTIAARLPGVLVERKPFSVAAHVRHVDPALRGQLVSELVVLGPQLDLSVLEGKLVVELAARNPDKRGAVEDLRRQLQIDAVLYAGDDVTDHDLVRSLAPPDLGVWVAPPDTEPGSADGVVVVGVSGMVAVLQRLVDLRSAALSERPATTR